MSEKPGIDHSKMFPRERPTIPFDKLEIEAERDVYQGEHIENAYEELESQYGVGYSKEKSEKVDAITDNKIHEDALNENLHRAQVKLATASMKAVHGGKSTSDSDPAIIKKALEEVRKAYVLKDKAKEE